MKSKINDINTEEMLKKEYDLDEACDLIVKTKTAKFNESIDISIMLGVDPQHAKENVRGVVKLPHGTGKVVKIAVFAKGDQAVLAKNAGADIVGAEDLIKKIEEGFFDFDKVLSTSDMMRDVSKLGRILGSKKMMPNLKSGTVSDDIVNTIKDVKKGRLEFRVEKAGIIHGAIGKSTFSKKNIKENIIALIQEVLRLKPVGLKGQYLKKVYISLTMGSSIKIITSSLL